MSLATDQNTGGLVDAMAARFAEADRRRMQLLDDAVKRNLKHVEEDHMPSCSRCGTEGHNQRTCPELKPKAEKKPEVPKVEKADARVAKARRPRAGGPDIDAMTVDELVEEIARCQALITSCQEELRRKRETIDRALGSAA